MTANPVLAEALRGNWVENRHRGAFAVVDAAGRIIASAGDIERPVYPRSAIKPMQALVLFTSGADRRFDLTDEELALAAASHHGEALHVERVSGLLARLGLGEGDLACGAHPPTNPAAREAMRAEGRKPLALHNSCSGKHAGMLAAARAMGVRTNGYVERDHPVQRAVRGAVETVIGEALREDFCGTDGCSIPTFAAPLRALARGFARMADGTGLPPREAAGARRILDAMTRHPGLVSGSGHPDTRLMTAFGGQLVQKLGAEGVQCGVLREKGWGYALKCDDGNMAASQAMLAALLLAIAGPGPEARAALETLARQPIRTVRGAQAGELRAVTPFPALVSAGGAWQ